MEKVYLLLRNNREAGPYTYEELLQQELLPNDLIWEEGKSTSWMQPAEWRAKNESVLSSQTTSSLKDTSTTINTTKEEPWYLKRRSPEAELEAKALALKEQAQAAGTSANYSAASPIKKRRHQVIYHTDEPPLLLEVHTINKKMVSFPQLLAVGIMTALVATGWYHREKLALVRPQNSLVTQAATPVVFQVTPAVLPAVVLPPKDTVATESIVVATETPVVPKAPSGIRSNLAIADKSKEPATKANTTDTAMPAMTVVKQQEPEIKEVVEPVIVKKEPVIDNKDTATAIETTTSNTAKKKGLGQAIKNIFKKKKKVESEDLE